MSIPQKTSNALFIDFVPAELHENKTWMVEYSVKNPFTGKLHRKQTRVKPLKSLTERRKLAKRMILNINKRLESGWNPFYENKGSKEFAKLFDAMNIFLRRTEIEFKDGNLRKDTLKTYTSQVNILKDYILIVADENMMCFNFDSDFVGKYLDNVRYEKGRSARTRDNYLMFLGTLSRWLISKKYITANPTEHFSKINRKEKKRIIISESDSTIKFIRII